MTWLATSVLPFFPSMKVALSAGVVEYTNCTSAKKCTGYDTKQSDDEVPLILEL